MTRTVGDLATEVIVALKERSLTVACAESLTGGEACSRLVDVPGSSAVVRGGIVAYATDLKHELLGVSEDALASGGPVQPEVAAQMAQGVARLCRSQLGLATTGVAGPNDTDDGPAGLAYIATAMWAPSTSSFSVETLKLCLAGDRDKVRHDVVRAAYAMLLDTLWASM